MHAFCPHCNGDVDAVIDQQRNPICFGDLVQLPGSLNLNCRVAFLVSVLHSCDSYGC